MPLNEKDMILSEVAHFIQIPKQGRQLYGQGH